MHNYLQSYITNSILRFYLILNIPQVIIRVIRGRVVRGTPSRNRLNNIGPIMEKCLSMRACVGDIASVPT